MKSVVKLHFSEGEDNKLRFTSEFGSKYLFGENYYYSTILSYISTGEIEISNENEMGLVKLHLNLTRLFVLITLYFMLLSLIVIAIGEGVSRFVILGFFAVYLLTIGSNYLIETI